MNTNTSVKPDQPQIDEYTKQSHWLVWLLIGLASLFLIIVIILRGLCTDIWYIRILGLNDKLCTTSTSNLPNASTENDPRLSLLGATLTVSTNNGSSMVDLSSLLQPGSIGPAGPIGASGFNGLKGSAGVAGATGPAGPTDPCLVAGTYFCQGGNSFGATALLGTNDNYDLSVVTGGAESYYVDTSGNLVFNRLGSTLSVPNPTFGPGIALPVSESNLVIPTNYLSSGLYGDPTVASSTSGFNGNIGFLDNAVVTDSVNNIGYFMSRPGGSISNLQASVGFFEGTIDSAIGLVGQFDGNISNSWNLMGSFGGTVSSSGGSISTNGTNNVLGSFNSSDLTDVYLTLGGTEHCQASGAFNFGCEFNTTPSVLTDVNRSLAFMGNSNLTGATQSLVMVEGNGFIPFGPSLSSTVTDINSSYLLGHMLNANTINSSAILLNGDSDPAVYSSVSGVSYTSIIGHDLNIDTLAFTALIGEDFDLSGTAADSYSLIGSNATGAGTPNMRLNFNGYDSWLNLSGGNVGIGTNTPSEKLEVNGNALVDNHFAAGAGNSINDVSLLHPGQTGWIVNNNAETITDVTSYERLFGVTGNLLVDPVAVAGIFHSIGGVEGAVAIAPGNTADFSSATIGGVRGAADFFGSGNAAVLRAGDFGTTWLPLAGAPTAGEQTGLKGFATAHAGSVTDQAGVRAYILNGGGAAAVTDSYGLEALATNGGTITNLYGVKVQTPSNTGTITNNYGIYIADQSSIATTDSFNIYSAGSGSTNYFAGNVGVGATVPANKLDVTDTTDDTPASFTGTSGTCTVDTLGGGWSCVSDQNLKANILSINNGLDIINQLQGVTYNWKVNPDGPDVSGFIAQDVQRILPNLVTTLPDGTLTLNKDGIMPYIVEAVKQQNGNIDAANEQLADQGIQINILSDDMKKLIGRVDSLETEVQDLKATVKQLQQKVEGAASTTTPSSINTTTNP